MHRVAWPAVEILEPLEVWPRMASGTSARLFRGMILRRHLNPWQGEGSICYNICYKTFRVPPRFDVIFQAPSTAPGDLP